MDVNLRAAFLASKSVYPHMKSQGGGQLVNIGSMFSLFGGGGSGAPYSSSQGGLVQLSKSLAVPGAKSNIQSNPFLPGWFMTELTARSRRPNQTATTESAAAYPTDAGENRRNCKALWSFFPAVRRTT